MSSLSLLITPQPECNASGTSPEGPLKVLTSGIFRGPSGDSYRTKKNIDDLIKKVFFRCNSLSFIHLLLFFTEKKIYIYSKVLNGDVHDTSTGPSCGTSRGTNDGTFWERPRDLGHILFLNSTQKHIKLTLTSYSSELW